MFVFVVVVFIANIALISDISIRILVTILQMIDTYLQCNTGATRRVPLVEQELSTLPEHMSSPPVLVGIVLLDL